MRPRHSRNCTWSRSPARASKLLKQGLGVDKVGSVEALGEPVIDVGEHHAGLVTTALRCEQSSEAHRGAQFERFGTLFTGNLDGALKALLSLRSIGIDDSTRNWQTRFFIRTPPAPLPALRFAGVIGS